MTVIRSGIAGAVAFIFAAAGAQAQFLANGNFEELDPGDALFVSWANNAGAQLASTPIGGDHSARLSQSFDGHLRQGLTDPGGALAVWSVTLDVALSDPGSPGARSFQLNVPHSTGGNINMRIVQGSSAGIGTVQFFNGSAWVTGLADAVTFSADEADLQVNNVTLQGDYSGAAPAYSLAVNGSLASGLTHWQAGAPGAGATITQLSFETGNFAGGSWAVVDNISVIPEPSTYAAIAGAVMFGFLLIRRRWMDRL